jgi:hypothetical protein
VSAAFLLPKLEFAGILPPGIRLSWVGRFPHWPIMERLLRPQPNQLLSWRVELATVSGLFFRSRAAQRLAWATGPTGFQNRFKPELKAMPFLLGPYIKIRCFTEVSRKSSGAEFFYYIYVKMGPAMSRDVEGVA